MPRNEVDYDFGADQVFNVGQIRPFETNIGLGLLCRLLGPLQKTFDLGMINMELAGSLS